MVKNVKDAKLSPMTYKKLRELGYNENTWKNLTQEQANIIIMEATKRNLIKPSKKNPREERQRKHAGQKLRSPHKYSKVEEDYVGVMIDIFGEGYDDVLVDDKSYVRDEHLHGTIYENYKDGMWTPTRRALHRKIIDDTFSGLMSKEKCTYTLFGGNDCSEKNNIELDMNNSVIINVGLIKKMLPEYTIERPFTVYEEASLLSKRIVELALRHGYSVIDVGSQDTGYEWISSKLTLAKENGADELIGIYGFNSDKRATKVNSERIQMTERKELEESRERIKGSLWSLAKEFDRFELYDTNSKPKLVYKCEGGKKMKIDSRFRLLSILWR